MTLIIFWVWLFYEIDLQTEIILLTQLLGTVTYFLSHPTQSPASAVLTFRVTCVYIYIYIYIYIVF